MESALDLAADAGPPVEPQQWARQRVRRQQRLRARHRRREQALHPAPTALPDVGEALPGQRLSTRKLTTTSCRFIRTRLTLPRRTNFPTSCGPREQEARSATKKEQTRLWRC